LSKVIKKQRCTAEHVFPLSSDRTPQAFQCTGTLRQQLYSGAVASLI